MDGGREWEEVEEGWGRGSRVNRTDRARDRWAVWNESKSEKVWRGVAPRRDRRGGRGAGEGESDKEEREEDRAGDAARCSDRVEVDPEESWDGVGVARMA